MQTEYPKKHSTIHWDTLNTVYPTRKFPSTGVTSETIGHEWRTPPEVLRSLIKKDYLNHVNNYERNYNVTKELTRSQTNEDYTFKLPETNRFNKHTSCLENEYIYPLPKKITEYPPQCRVHGTTEMKSEYKVPTTPHRLITNKDQYKHCSILYDNKCQEPSFHKELPPIYTTHEGFEKYLDPYLTTSRLEHRPFTAEQLSRPSNTKDIITFYTYANVPWTRTPAPNLEQIQLPLSRPRSMYDRSQFKQDFREIRTHNKQRWVPGSFRTESRDNYTSVNSRPGSKIQHFQEQVRNYYKSEMSKLPTFQDGYFEKTTENSHYGSGKPLCSVMDQFVARNKRLERKLCM